MISYHGLSDVGRRRALNEDTIYAADNLFVVCDGMGGHKAGEVASKLAVDVIASFVRRSGEDAEITWPFGFHGDASFEGNRLRTAVKLANRAILRKAASADEYSGMGTTVVAALVSAHRPQLTYLSVGDSRIYLIRAGAILQLTRDDSWEGVSWDAGEDEAARASVRHVLTKALGAADDVDFEVSDMKQLGGDVLLLCSDGLTNMLSDDRILQIVTASGADLDRACRELIAAANAEGGRDNVSVVLVRRDS
jgi:protein phosphatase